MTGWWELIVFIVLVAIVSSGGTLLVMSVVNKPSKLKSAPIQSEATSPSAVTAHTDESPAERRAA